MVFCPENKIKKIKNRFSKEALFEREYPNQDLSRWTDNFILCVFLPRSFSGFILLTELALMLFYKTILIKVLLWHFNWSIVLVTLINKSLYYQWQNVSERSKLKKRVFNIKHTTTLPLMASIYVYINKPQCVVFSKYIKKKKYFLQKYKYFLSYENNTNDIATK